jgi:DNA uptake protein ComE-like DNA-binding protein
MNAPFRVHPAEKRGSVLIIVMLICMGLVALTLYFASSMSAELRASDNRANDTAAREAAAGGMRYASYVLKNFSVGGVIPDPTTDYQAAALPVGDASFWFIGRDPNQIATTEPVFALVDESSKLNLNTANSAMLQALPGMTPDLAQAIIDWRSPSGSAGAASGTYAALNPPRLNKGAPFESVDELRLVNGATLDLLLGEDTNRNGALDTNEDDGAQSPPADNQDAVLQPGLWEYVTVYSKQPNTRPDGSARINITAPQLRNGLSDLLQRRLNAARAAAIMARLGTRNFSSVAEFMVTGGFSADEFQKIHTDITASTGATANGLVNVNTASATVLACIPGIGTNNAAAIVAYRLAHLNSLTSLAWVAQVLTRADLLRAGPYITDQSYQFSADIAAVGPFGRGYDREKVVFDTSTETPRIIYHENLNASGWALGATVRQSLKTPKEI